MSKLKQLLDEIIAGNNQESRSTFSDYLKTKVQGYVTEQRKLNKADEKAEKIEDDAQKDIQSADKKLSKAKKLEQTNEGVRVMGKTRHGEPMQHYHRTDTSPEAIAHRNATAQMAKTARAKGASMRHVSGATVDARKGSAVQKYHDSDVQKESFQRMTPKSDEDFESKRLLKDKRPRKPGQERKISKIDKFKKAKE